MPYFYLKTDRDVPSEIAEPCLLLHDYGNGTKLWQVYASDPQPRSVYDYTELSLKNIYGLVKVSELGPEAKTPSGKIKGGFAGSDTEDEIDVLMLKKEDPKIGATKLK